MATRANVVIKNGGSRSYIYHHYDGYPDGVGAELKEMMRKVQGKSAKEIEKEILNYKGSRYEKTRGIHGDVEYIYTLDLQKGTLSYQHGEWKNDDDENRTFGRSVQMMRFASSPSSSTRQGGGSRTSSKGAVAG